jgi:DNA-binding NtrC family response regulator
MGAGLSERPQTILLVEDEILLRVCVADYLQEFGFRVLGASTADEAIKVIQQGAVPVDLVFSDIRMPGEIDGLGLAEWIRQNRPDLPIILTTGGGLPAGAKALCEDTPLIPKPYDLQRLAGRLRTVLEAQQRC